MKRGIVILVLLLCAGAGIAHAQFGGPTEPQARLQLESREAYAGMPFNVVVVAEGFDADPAPAQPALNIPGATVTALGADPQVQRISINGQRYDSVTWIFRWRVEASKAGTFEVPAVTITQGSKKATAAGGTLPVTEIATTEDMRIQVVLPDRPVWVGEVVPIEIQWLLRRDVHDQQLSVPVLAMPDAFVVSVPAAKDPRQVLSFPAGKSDVELPFERDQATVDGKTFTRFRFRVEIAPQRAGRIEIAPAQVVASLEVGQGRDRFGFPSARTKLFRAADVARTLEVKPLPQTGRPASFAGAVGTSFSIAARTSRSVVQLGEPVDLEITVKGDTRLDGLALGPLTGPGRLPAERFAAPDTTPPGELADDGLTKTFRVAVQVTDPATTEIPPLELAWFDPAAGTYRSTKSEPIALSVKGGSVVGAGQVVGRRPSQAPAAPGAPAGVEDVSLVGADLALSAPGAASERPLGGALLWVVVGLLYVVPLSVLGFRWWRVRTAGAREERGEVAAARKKLEAELARARTAAARDTAGALVAALRAYAKVLGREAADPLLARIETEGYAPDAAAHPLPSTVVADAEQLAKRWAAEARPRRAAAASTAALVLVIGGVASMTARVADAQPAPGAAGAAQSADPAAAAPTASPSTEPAAGAPQSTDDVAAAPRSTSAGASGDVAALMQLGRAAYQDAMASTDPSMRQAAFARAEAALGDAAAARPDSAELLADWGNAALGAADLGTATLAFRRALLADGDHARARKNLAWLRSRLPDNLRPHEGGATATLFFFHRAWTRSTRLIVGALAFAVAALLLVPWRRRPRGGRVALAMVAVAIWVLMTGSVLLEGSPVTDGVVVQSQVLRSADSPGAPAATATPLPPGAEVTILERRDGWTRLRTAGGLAGWLPDAAVAPVVVR